MTKTLFTRALWWSGLALLTACGGGNGESEESGGASLVNASGPEGSRFGVVTGGIYRAGPHRLDVHGDEVFGEMTTGLGVGWVRLEAGWQGLPDKLLGQMIEKARAHGLSVVVVLQPELSGGPATDADVATYLQRIDGLLNDGFASNAAHPYAIEVGNELNGSRWSANMVAWLARRVKEHLLGDARWRDIKVISAGTANSYARDESWYADFFGSGAFRCVDPAPGLYGCAPNAPFMPFDHMGVHPYDGGKVDLGCINAEQIQCFDFWKSWVRDDLANIRARLASASGTSSELMITEFGWQSPPQGWHTSCPNDMGTFHNCVRTPDQMRAAMQASYEAFHTENPWAWAIHAAIWYDALDDDAGTSGKHFGTRTAGGAAKNDVWQKLRGLTGDPSYGDPDAFWRGQKFLDLPPSEWDFGYVQTLAADGILDGQPSGNFGPGGLPTRGEFSTMLGRALTYGTIDASQHHYGTRALASPARATFSDVSTADPRFQYIETLAQAGVISGYSDGTFRPQNTLTRGQAVKMLVGANGWPQEFPGTPTFSDVQPGSPFFGYVEAAHSHHLIDGYSDGTFRPNASLTRAQIAKMLAMSFVGP